MWGLPVVLFGAFQMFEIKLPVNTYDSSTLISVKIWRYGKGHNKLVDCDMIFDTGATMTTLDRQLALRAGYNLRNAKPIEVDGIGRSNIPGIRITIPHLELRGYDLGPVSVDVIDFPKNSNTLALLGLNVIRHFKTTIEFQPVKPDGLITMVPLFDINDKPSLENFIPSISRFGIWSLSNMSKFTTEREIR
jgi:hypothetical protein